MERERATGTPLLLLDSGNAFLKDPGDAANAPLAELTSQAMIEGLGNIGYDALNLGRTDLLLPTELLRSLAARASFPLLSANIVDAAGKAPFKGWVLKEVGGLRVGIFGVSGNQQQNVPVLPGRTLAVQDPATAARAAVAALRGSADIVIALSQLGLAGDAELALAAPGIDLILGGSSRQVTPEPRVAGTTLIFHSGAKGMQLGRLALRVVPGRQGAWTRLAAARGGEARVYDWSVVQLNTTLPDHPALAALLARHNEELRSRAIAQQAAAPPAPPPAAVPAYVGAAVCGSCHPAHLEQWSRSRHAQALAGLIRKRQERNPACIGCHVTGYGVGGYRLGADAGVDLANVQCEACHGFGREHRGKGKIRGRVPESICRRCHSTENSPTFKYEPYLRLLGGHAAGYFARKTGAGPVEPRR